MHIVDSNAKNIIILRFSGGLLVMKKPILVGGISVFICSFSVLVYAECTELQRARMIVNEVSDRVIREVCGDPDSERYDYREDVKYDSRITGPTNNDGQGSRQRDSRDLAQERYELNTYNGFIGGHLGFGVYTGISGSPPFHEFGFSLGLSGKWFSESNIGLGFTSDYYQISNNESEPPRVRGSMTASSLDLLYVFKREFTEQNYNLWYAGIGIGKSRFKLKSNMGSFDEDVDTRSFLVGFANATGNDYKPGNYIAYVEVRYTDIDDKDFFMDGVLSGLVGLAYTF